MDRFTHYRPKRQENSAQDGFESTTRRTERTAMSAPSVTLYISALPVNCSCGSIGIPCCGFWILWILQTCRRSNSTSTKVGQHFFAKRFWSLQVSNSTVLQPHGLIHVAMMDRIFRLNALGKDLNFTYAIESFKDYFCGLLALSWHWNSKASSLEVTINKLSNNYHDRNVPVWIRNHTF
jgi:hypothetical protein